MRRFTILVLLTLLATPVLGHGNSVETHAGIHIFPGGFTSVETHAGIHIFPGGLISTETGYGVHIIPGGFASVETRHGLHIFPDGFAPSRAPRSHGVILGHGILTGPVGFNSDYTHKPGERLDAARARFVSVRPR